MDIGSHFFEFISESEVSSKNPITFRAEEIKEGRYFILPTTSSGLYRYNINDLIEVTGFYNQAPIIKFLSKGDNISSLTGEKITENQVIKAMEKTNKKYKKNIDTFLVSPFWESPAANSPRYILLLEDNLDKENLKEFSQEFDRNLREINMEYDSKRKDRIEELVLGILPIGTFENQRKDFLKKSQKDTQYKHQFLNPEINFHEKIGARIIL